MRDRLTITISDINKTRSYNVHQVIKKIVVYTIIFILLAFILGGTSIWFLQTRVEQLTDKKEAIKSEYKKLLNLNTVLTKQINEKAEEFESISERVEDIEGLIGLKFDTRLTLNEKVDIASLSAKEKSIILEQIPNGYPIVFKGTTGKYGWRKHPILKRREFHAGIDLRAKMKTPIYAPANAVVEYARFHKKSGYGNLVILSHNYGFKTLYGHLEKIKVKSGDIVKKGDLIALSGNTGLSSGPHLHYEVKYINMPLEPKNFMDWNLSNYDVIFEKEKKVKWQSLVNLINHSHKVQQSLQKAQK